MSVGNELTRSLTEDLTGLKVSHDLEGMAEGEEQILTLKDSRILDGEGMCATSSLPIHC